MKRGTPLVRTGFKAKEPKPPTGPRKRRCALKTCRTEFVPRNMLHRACGPSCALLLAVDERQKQERKAAKAERAETKKKLEKFKSIPTLKAEVQVIFNKYIRLRDQLAGHGCICCGKFPTAAALAQPGGAWDACHYKSRGSADHLRFNEANVHRGLKDCNTWGHKDYRGGLIVRIGLDAVEALEADQAAIKWTKEGLNALKAEYRKKLKELQNNTCM